MANGANGGIQPIAVFRDGIAGDIEGTVPGRGFLDVHSDFIDDLGVFHLTAAVGAGPFRIDLFQPHSNSQNAVILESGQGLRNGTILITFTERATGNTSAYAVIE